MKIAIVEQRDAYLIERLTQVWESSVRATHTFLSEGDIVEIRDYVPMALQGVAHLVVANDDDVAVAFMGVENQRLEMLFVADDMRGGGIGRRLLEFGIANYDICEVTVNEQNPQAVAFYEHLGFKAYRRSECDEQGRPFPLLYMQLDRSLRESE
jgi:putative acetyltransferase